MENKELLLKGEKICETLSTMGAVCRLKNCVETPLVDKFEFELPNLNNYNKIHKAIATMSKCLHEEFSLAESTDYHFAIQVKKDSVVLKYDDYKPELTNKATAFLGIDDNGTPICFDIDKSIHTLIAGATGMGKTSVLNNIIKGLTSQNTIDELQLYLIDIKQTLTIWKGLPHLACKPITKAGETYTVLRRIGRIMEERQNILAKKKLTKAKEGMFPRIVVIIDELADLMLDDSYNAAIEDAIVHLAQVGRAVNISLIIATQNPLVKVCTSLIKANCPTRIAMTMASARDSINIIGNKEASLLSGSGYGIISVAGQPKKQYFKACFIEDDEIKKYVKDLKGENK